ncbi:hypothetical protein CKAN_00823600 [Cinnamomum micranthum f. kanehirae]|uniref:RGS1-HXK1-interacting protein 1 n=1 Tax=Cinnamomum micranthum f. kanehirae TaxID=337451 RepID=A0A3S3Q5E6_9MAGN|nr:hypothetical protein CKAN_00823600 [Cinnamomum micranthum f. kanehirae]
MSRPNNRPQTERERERERERMAETSPPSSEASAPQAEGGKPWHSYTAEDLKRAIFGHKDSAAPSTPSLHQNPAPYFLMLQDVLPQVESQYKAYEDAFFQKFKDELMFARESTQLCAVCGVVGSAALILLRGPRRFLFRHTLGRFQSEEAQFLKVEKNVKDFGLSVDLMKNESKKLLERAALAEDDMKKGHAKLKDAGNEIRRLVKSVYKIESETADLMERLRAIPGRDAIKLRAEVASMASFLRQQRTALDKRILKISELGISV